MAYFTEKGDQYKQELISELEDGTITYYTNGQFTDLCRGPHLRNTEVIKAVKVLSLAGAYWRGDETRQQLTRIYGITFPKKSMLDEYLVMLEEAKKRDHRKIGKEMELFTFSQRVGPGLPLWLPKGATLRNTLENFLRKKQAEYGYLQVVTPHIGGKELYVTSGHYAKYGKDSFQPIHTPQEGEEFMLKPVYRYEQSGELHGLTRVRGFTQDDAHLFCRQDQIQEEFEKVIDLILYVFKTLHFDKFTAQVSLRDPKNPSKYIGSDENWEKAEAGIIEAAKKKGLPFVLRPEAGLHGEGRHRPELAAGHDPGGLQPPGALRAGVCRFRRLPQASGDDPPRPVRFPGAFRGRAPRAHRRPSAALGPSRTRQSPASQRKIRRLCEKSCKSAE